MKNLCQIKTTIKNPTITLEAKQEILNVRAAGLISQKTAIAALGYVDDLEAEIEALAAETAQNQSL